MSEPDALERLRRWVAGRDDCVSDVARDVIAACAEVLEEAMQEQEHKWDKPWHDVRRRRKLREQAARLRSVLKEEA